MYGAKNYRNNFVITEGHYTHFPYGNCDKCKPYNKLSTATAALTPKYVQYKHDTSWHGISMKRKLHEQKSDFFQYFAK